MKNIKIKNNLLLLVTLIWLFWNNWITNWYNELEEWEKCKSKMECQIIKTERRSVKKDSNKNIDKKSLVLQIKTYKKILQKLRKTHKFLVKIYNNNLQNKNIFEKVQYSWIMISNISKKIEILKDEYKKNKKNYII